MKRIIRQLLRGLIPASWRARRRHYKFGKEIRKLPDRHYMENEILPALKNLQPSKVLFVGTEIYTRHYSKWFNSKSCEYWTMDIRPEVSTWGAKRRHLTASVVEADKLFPHNAFDIVVLNGVLGWGVDSIADQNQTIEALRKILKPEGVLVVGWNNDRVSDPLELKSIKRHFSRGIGGALPDRKKFAKGTHVYDFLRAR